MRYRVDLVTEDDILAYWCDAYPDLAELSPFFIFAVVLSLEGRRCP